MLSDADLATMRATQEVALPETCTRVRTPLVADGQGGYTKGTATTATLACRVSSRGLPSEYLQMATATGKELRMVTLPHGSDVKRTDTLLIDGVTYQVIGFASAGDWETALRVVCEVVS
jgi:hypothetical protein